MKFRVVYECPDERRRWRFSKLLAPALSLLAAGAVIGAWACAPREPRPVAATAAASFLPVAQAPTAQPEPAPAPEPPPPDPHLGQIQELEQALARALATSDQRAAELEAASRRGFPVSERMEMSSTMYCLKGHMRTGVRTRDGMAAGDPRVLPLGSVVRVTHPDGRPIGIFVIMDTGGAIRGNKIDIYVDSCPEAVRWGRRPVEVEVLAIGRASPGDLR
jgi:3D (Asp-Asp-Asp) domain-containing protein